MFEKIKESIAAQLSVDPADIKMESDIVKDLKADSIAIVELMFKLEEDYDITIEDEEATSIKTVGDIVKFLEKKGVK